MPWTRGWRSVSLGFLVAFGLLFAAAILSYEDVAAASRTGRLALLGMAASVVVLVQAFARLRRENQRRTAAEAERAAASEELVRVNRLLSAKMEEAEAMNRELENFSYSVSHDLRAPLRAVDGFARYFEEDYGSKVDDEGRRRLAVITENVRRMGRLIDDLLAFSRCGRQPLSSAAVDIGALVRTLAVEFEAARGDHQLTIRIGELPAAIGDRPLLRQAFHNLLDNAVKFSRMRSPAEVRIEGRREGAEVTYQVSDNGVGFDMQYAGKLFGMFQRLHGREEFEGTGVGLALVQRIVQRHGGRVKAEARPEEGASFFVTLPAAE